METRVIEQSGGMSATGERAVGDCDARAERVSRWCWIAMALLVIAKLVMVSHDEILTFTDDDAGYALSAGFWHWDTTYGTFTHSRQPVYDLYLALAGTVGVPVRLWIEFTWIGACTIMVVALRRMRFTSIMALVAFAIVLFQPWATMLFRRFLSDTLYGPLFLVFICALAAGLMRTRWPSTARWGLLAGGAAALAANTRAEAILITASLVVGAACVLAMWLFKISDRRTALARLMCMALVPLVMTQALTQVFRSVNQARIGARVTHDLDLPGFKRLNGHLLSLPVVKPNLKVCIPREAREWAYAHSPTFARLQPFLDGQDERVGIYAKPVEAATGVQGEYGAWLVWALRVAAWRMQRWSSAGELDAFYAQAADELEAAIKSEHVKVRWVPASFVPPEWDLWRRDLPTSLGACWTRFANAEFHRSPNLEVWPAAHAAFDAVGNRRTALVTLNDGKKIEHSWWHSAPVVSWMDRLKQRIAATQRPLVRVGWVIAALGAVLGLVAMRWRLLHARWYVLAALLWSAIAMRVLLVAMLDATGIAVQWRYLFAAAPLSIILIVLNAQTIVFLAATVVRRRKSSPATQAP